jgi:hypothetical protein
MFLSIATTHQPATDLGYLLHKHPERLHEIELTFAKAWVFYPEASPTRCEAALVLDVDPVGLVRGKGQAEGLLALRIVRAGSRWLASGTPCQSPLCLIPASTFASSVTRRGLTAPSVGRWGNEWCRKCAEVSVAFSARVSVRSGSLLASSASKPP